MSKSPRWSESIEDYLKAIYRVTEHGERATGQAVAAELGVSQASVTAMMKRLDEHGLVEHEPYRGTVLTDLGREAALVVVRSHRLLETYLADVLGMSWDEVHAEAEVLEHHLSDRLGDLIAEKLGHPRFDPHGDPIPQADGTLPEIDATELAQLPIGGSGVVRRVSHSNSEVLQYLASIGVRPGSSVSVAQVGPFEGPVTVEVEGGERHAVSFELANAIHVSVRDARVRETVSEGVVA